jgi:hypothetical protein
MQDTSIVFVRGTGRCGSRTAIQQLGTHSALSRVPVNEILPEELLNWSRHRLQSRSADITDEVIEAACRSYFETYCRKMAGDGIIVQKTTMHAHRLGDLLKLWPAAKIIYLVRHPIGVVESLINANVHWQRSREGFVTTVANSLMRWYNEMQAYLRSEAYGHSRVLQIHFEDMIADPVKVFGRIYDFIGVQDPAQTLSHPPDRYEKQFVLNERERGWILESCREMVTKLGYDPDKWSADVPSARQHLVHEYAECRLKNKPPSLDGIELLQMALQSAKEQGYRRVAFLGGGYFAELVLPYLDRPCVEVVGVLDENPVLGESRIGSYPIYRIGQARSLGIDAVVPLTMVHQGRLIERWRMQYGDDIQVVPLWLEDSLESAGITTVAV